MPSHEQLLDGTLLGQAVILVGYFITSLVVISNNYAGFNGFFTGLIFGGSIYLVYYGLRHISRTFYGIMLGVIAILVFVSLESAIFWGQYSSCAHYSTKDDSSPPTMSPTSSSVESRRSLESLSAADAAALSFDSYQARALSGYINSECRSQGAMKSMCFFSVVMFLSYLVLGGLLAHFKNDILGSAPLNEGYDEVTATSTSGKVQGTTATAR